MIHAPIPGSPRHRTQTGFTLIELLVVIVILGILSAVVVFAVRGAGDKGQGAAVATDKRTIRTAQEAFCANKGRYATMDELVPEYLSTESEIHNVGPVDPSDPDRQGNCGTEPSTKHYEITCRISNCDIGGPITPVETCDLPASGPGPGGAGVPDQSFDLDGKQTTDFGGANPNRDEATAVVVDTNDRVVAVGNSAAGGFALARYDACGVLDPTFDGDGMQTTTIPAPGGATISSARASAVASDAAGNVVVAGTANLKNGDGTEHTDFVVARYTPAGALDSTFGGDGVVTTDIGAASNDEANGVAVRNDNIVVVGSSNDHIAVVRYGPTGILDTDFDSDGKVTTDMGPAVPGVPGAHAAAVVVYPDNKILVAGRAPNPSPVAPSDMAFARYNAGGNLDLTFGLGGKVTLNNGYQEGASSLVLQPDGKIVAGGTLTPEGDTIQHFVVVRLRVDGTPDAGFGRMQTELGPVDGTGVYSAIIGEFNSSARGVALQADGKIVAVGFASQTNQDFVAVRLKAENGLPDASFGSGGKGRVFTDFGGNEQALGIAIHPSGSGNAAGRIVAVGVRFSADFTNSDFALARHLAA